MVLMKPLSYDIFMHSCQRFSQFFVQAYAGQRKGEPGSEQVYCIAESEMSNTIPVMCPAPPSSPSLRLEGMHSDGIDVTWEMPQQFGDAAVSVSAVKQTIWSGENYTVMHNIDRNTAVLPKYEWGQDCEDINVLVMWDLKEAGWQEMKPFKMGQDFNFRSFFLWKWKPA